MRCICEQHTHIVFRVQGAAFWWVVSAMCGVQTLGRSWRPLDLGSVLGIIVGGTGGTLEQVQKYMSSQNGRSGELRTHLGEHLDDVRHIVGQSRILAHLGDILQDILRDILGHLGTSWDILRDILGHLGTSCLGHLAGHPETSWDILGHLGESCGTPWDMLGHLGTFGAGDPERKRHSKTFSRHFKEI